MIVIYGPRNGDTQKGSSDRLYFVHIFYCKNRPNLFSNILKIVVVIIDYSRKSNWVKPMYLNTIF